MEDGMDKVIATVAAKRFNPRITVRIESFSLDDPDARTPRFTPRFQRSMWFEHFFAEDRPDAVRKMWDELLTRMADDMDAHLKE